MPLIPQSSPDRTVVLNIMPYVRVVYCTGNMQYFKVGPDDFKRSFPT